MRLDQFPRGFVAQEENRSTRWNRFGAFGQIIASLAA
jgi:hypothetical protein